MRVHHAVRRCGGHITGRSVHSTQSGRPDAETDEMAISPSVIAFTVILALYITVGVFAAIGTAYLSKTLLPPKLEQVFPTRYTWL